MVDDVINSYINRTDWRTAENANDGRSISGLKAHVVGDVLAKHLLDSIPEKVSDAHRTGRIHIHDCRGGIHASYCCGADLKEILMKGLGISNNVKSLPAKHLDVAVDHIGNFIQIMSNEHEGAIALSSFDTLLAPFVKEDNLTQKQVTQQMQRLVYGLNYESRQGFQCVTEDTEVLTPNGFKNHETLEVGDDIYTWNNGALNVQKVKAVNVKDYKGEMHVYSGRGFNQTVTPNHIVLRKAYNSDKYIQTESSKLINRKSALPIPVSMLSNDTEDYDISDAMLKMVVMLLTDGHIKNKQNVVLYKSDLRWGNEFICDTLDELGMEYTHRHRVRRGYGENAYYVLKASSAELLGLINHDRKSIPQWFYKLSERQAQIVINTWSSFDGCNGNDKQRLQCDNDYIADGLQHVCFLAGHSSRKFVRHFKPNENNVVTQNACDVLYVQPYKSDTKWMNNNYKIYYTGKVWCPSTDDGIVVYRKDGRIFISCNSPFSNLSLDWVVPKDLEDVPCIVGGKIMSYTYSGLQSYMDMINIGLLNTLIDGDANGKPLTFPIPTYAIRDESMFTDTDEKTRLIWELTARTGAPYFSNFLGSGIDPYTFRSFCCRLSIDLNAIADATGGIWDIGAKTGSLSVVTINANRAALEANGDTNTYFANLIEYADIATDVLLLRKDNILEAFNNGLMPYTKEYIGKLNSFFLTHGVVGVFDAYMNMDTQCDYYQFADDTLKTLKGYSKCLSTTTDWKLWNIEQTPMEGGAYRLAKSDREYYPDCYVGGDGDDIYLTNSTHLPVDNECNIIDEINIRSNLDRMYTGGTLFNYYANESASPESVKELIHKLCLNTKLPYIAYTPTFGICEHHGITYGSDRCSVCSEPIEVYTRVVGYIRPASKFNIGQLQQFKNRKYHNTTQE